MRDGIETLEMVVRKEGYRIDPKASVTRGQWYVMADYDVHPIPTLIPAATHVVLVAHPDDVASLEEQLMLTRLMMR